MVTGGLETGHSLPNLDITRGYEMSNFIAAAYHPKLKVVMAAMHIDDYFGNHIYGIAFEGDDHVYKPNEVRIPIDIVFRPEPIEETK